MRPITRPGIIVPLAQHIARWPAEAGLLLMVLLFAGAAPVRAQAADTLAGAVWSAYDFSDARSLRADPAGRIYVADAAGTVVVLGGGGVPLRSVSGTDRAPLLAPEDLDPTNGLVLLVADAGAGRIYRFGDDGRVLESLGGPDAPRASTFGAPEPDEPFVPVAVASNARNEVFALDENGRRLYRWDVSRQRTVLSGPDDGVLQAPRALAVSADRLFVLDQSEVVVFDRFGTPVRRFAHRHAAEARRIRLLGERIALVLPDGLALYTLEGGLERLMPWSGPPLRDAALTDAALFLLTARALYRIER